MIAIELTALIAYEEPLIGAVALLNEEDLLAQKAIRGLDGQARSDFDSRSVLGENLCEGIRRVGGFLVLGRPSRCARRSVDDGGGGPHPPRQSR